MKPNWLPQFAIILSILFWLVDSSIDVIIFSESETIMDSLINPEPVELWMRLFVVFLLVSFSFLSRFLLNEKISASNELVKYQKDLEKIIELRTKELRAEIEIRKIVEEELQKTASTDPLTELFNRRKFIEILNREMKRECRHSVGLFLIICDIDKFKDINDLYGHPAGDQVLKQFSHVIKNSLRKTDILARWGGEEFVMLFPNTKVNYAKKSQKN